MPLAHSSSSWETPPAVLLGAALALVLFVQAFVRLRRPQARPRALEPRLLLYTAGLALLALPLVSPLDQLGDEELLSAHMLQHVLMGDAAPALLVVAVRGPLLFFLLPPFLLRPLASFRPLRAVLALLLVPLVSLGVWAVTSTAGTSRRSTTTPPRTRRVHDLQHLSFVARGAAGVDPARRPARHERLRRPQRVFFALGMLALSQPLVDALLFTAARRTRAIRAPTGFGANRPALAGGRDDDRAAANPRDLRRPAAAAVRARGQRQPAFT